MPVSVAPSGMIFQTGNTVPALQGSVLVGALAGRALIQLPWQDNAITGNEKRWLDTAGERVRDVVAGPDGHPYLLTDSGRILRVDPSKRTGPWRDRLRAARSAQRRRGGEQADQRHAGQQQHRFRNQASPGD
ncbi:MAG: PQQ-dependent sugar dehydrogenase [Burkholderiaceae bacterium]